VDKLLDFGFAQKKRSVNYLPPHAAFDTIVLPDDRATSCRADLGVFGAYTFLRAVVL